MTYEEAWEDYRQRLRQAAPDVEPIRCMTPTDPLILLARVLEPAPDDRTFVHCPPGYYYSDAQNTWVSEASEKRLVELTRLRTGTWTPSVVTCDGCGAAASCEFAYDPYNTDGDCLAEK